jgi:putative oxidoreductase
MAILASKTRRFRTRPEGPLQGRGETSTIAHFTAGDNMISSATLESWTPRALGLLRIVIGYLYLQHGSAKLLGFPHVAMFDTVTLMSLMGLAGVLELVGGFLILVGLVVRPVAFILSGEMAVAYFMAHASKGNTLFPSLNGGELAVVYCFVFLFFAAAGAGAWSIDAAMRRRPV